MPVVDSSTFPLVGLQAVSNARNEWVGLAFQPHPDGGDAYQALLRLFSYPDMGAALAPLDCILPLHDPLCVEPSHYAAFPASRVVFQLPAAVFGSRAALQRCRLLADEGYRLLSEGEVNLPASETGLAGLAFNAGPMPSVLAMVALPGPHWVRHVDSDARREQYLDAGFNWVSGRFALETDAAAAGDGTSRKRILALLALLARDADSRELENLLKEDPALAFHLLKLVNSAIFGFPNPIRSFTQAINMLGRRQLQRWLQLLLYARQNDSGPANPLLPLAAVRAAQMETLAKLRGADREAQDLAFITGVFSLLDLLLAMPMADIVAGLQLDLDVVRALVERSGELGELLSLVEAQAPDAAAVRKAGFSNEAFWQSQLQAYHWAIQVSRNT